MKKIYTIIDNINGDFFERNFTNKKDALTYARHEWESLTTADKNRRFEYYVLERANDKTYDGAIIKTYK